MFAQNLPQLILLEVLVGVGGWGRDVVGLGFFGFGPALLRALGGDED